MASPNTDFADTASVDTPSTDGLAQRGGGLPRITPVGIAVAAGSVALGALGWALGYPALSVAAAIGLAALLATWIATVPVPRLDVSRVVQPTRVERGVPAIGLVAVRNPGRHRTRPCTAVDRVSGRDVDVHVRSLRAGQTVAVHYELPTSRRGEFTIGPLAIITRDPFGLWQGRRPVGGELNLLVYPRIHPVAPRPAGRTRHIEGPVSDTAPRGTTTFHSLREYVPGDDVRRIHWRSTARLGELMVREHVDTSLPSTVVVLDTRADRYVGDGFEEAVDVAASVIASSQQHGFPVQLVATDGTTFIVRAGHRGQAMRDYLATVQPGADERGEGDGLARAALDVSRGRHHDALVVVGGDLDAADLGVVTRIAGRFATSGLVTIRPDAPDRARWTGGLHLDGTTAAETLARWQHAATGRPTAIAPPARDRGRR